MADPKRVDSTLKNLINTSVQTRVLAHQLLLSPSPSSMLTDLQIRMLINSPLGSVLKSTLFANMVYAYLLHKHQLKQLEELLLKLGMKEDMRAYYDRIQELEVSDFSAHLRKIEDEYQKQNVPPSGVVEKLELELATYRNDLAAAILALNFVHSQQSGIVNSLVQANQHHVQLVMKFANTHNVVITNEQAATVVPRLRRQFHAVHTPQEQIKALSLLNVDGLPQNNLVRLQHFMSNNALNTTMRRFEENTEKLNSDLIKQNQSLAEAKLRCLGIEKKIQNTQIALEHFAKMPNKPNPEISPEMLKELAKQVDSSVSPSKGRKS